MYFNYFTIILLIIITFQLNILYSYHNINNDKNNIIIEEREAAPKLAETNFLDNYNNYQYYQKDYQKDYQKYNNKCRKNYNTEKLWIQPLFHLMEHIVNVIYLLVMEYFKVFQYCFCYTLNILVKLIDGYYHLLELLFKDILKYPTICYAIFGMFLALFQCNTIIDTILKSFNERYIIDKNNNKNKDKNNNKNNNNNSKIMN